MKNKIVAGLLALFLGNLGIHKFYLNETTPGVVYLVCTILGWLMAWCFIGLIPVIIIGILALIDAIKLLIMDDKVFDMRYNPGIDQRY